MTDQTFQIQMFFGGHPDALRLYEVFAQRVLAEIDSVQIRVQKTQIAFTNRHHFAFVSFLPARRAQCRPKTYITVTFGLPYRADSPRIDAASEPYPNRWTHHVLIARPEEIDAELMAWIQEAAAFSASKR